MAKHANPANAEWEISLDIDDTACGSCGGGFGDGGKVLIRGYAAEDAKGNDAAIAMFHAQCAHDDEDEFTKKYARVATDLLGNSSPSLVNDRLMSTLVNEYGTHDLRIRALLSDTTDALTMDTPMSISIKTDSSAFISAPIAGSLPLTAMFETVTVWDIEVQWDGKDSSFDSRAWITREVSMKLMTNCTNHMIDCRAWAVPGATAPNQSRTTWTTRAVICLFQAPSLAGRAKMVKAIREDAKDEISGLASPDSLRTVKAWTQLLRKGHVGMRKALGRRHVVLDAPNIAIRVSAPRSTAMGSVTLPTGQDPWLRLMSRMVAVNMAAPGRFVLGLFSPYDIWTVKTNKAHFVVETGMPSCLDDVEQVDATGRFLKEKFGSSLEKVEHAIVLM